MLMTMPLKTTRECVPPLYLEDGTPKYARAWSLSQTEYNSGADLKITIHSAFIHGGQAGAYELIV